MGKLLTEGLFKNQQIVAEFGRVILTLRNPLIADNRHLTSFILKWVTQPGASLSQRIKYLTWGESRTSFLFSSTTEKIGTFLNVLLPHLHYRFYCFEQSTWCHFRHLINWYILQRIQAWSETVLKGLKHQALTGGQSATCACHLSTWIFPFGFGSTLNGDFSTWAYSMEGPESTVFSELSATTFHQRLLLWGKLGLMIAANGAGILLVYSMWPWRCWH